MRNNTERYSLYDPYDEEESRLEEYRRSCKDEAMDMLKQHFFNLWD